MSINVLIVDESSSGRLALSEIISGAPDMQIVGLAVNGQEAVDMVEAIRPDVVLMDVLMPQARSIEATREIMHVCPTPIVIVSDGLEGDQTNIVIEALNAGALTVLQKPGDPQSRNYRMQIKELVSTVRSMSSVVVIHHPKHMPMPDIPSLDFQGTFLPRFISQPQIVAIVASTGGPQTIGEILRGLPSTFNLPIVIVQHITPEFVAPLAEWLGTVSRRPVRIAQQDHQPKPGTVYLAPGNTHLQFTGDRRFELTTLPTDVPHIPSGDIFLESVAAHYGTEAVGVLLTGMGKDGADGLNAMNQAGSITVAQNEASCVVFGMPQEAITLGAAQYILSPPEISALLSQCRLLLPIRII